MARDRSSSFFGYRNSPSRERWDAAANALGFAAAHSRNSRAMGGTINGHNIEIVDIPDAQLIMFIDIVDGNGPDGMPQFVVQMLVDDEPRQTGLRQVHTGDLTFEHQLASFGVKPNRVLDFLHLGRRDILLELQRCVLIDSMTDEGLRSTLELGDWEAEDLVEIVTAASEIVMRFFEPSAGMVEQPAA